MQIFQMLFVNFLPWPVAKLCIFPYAIPRIFQFAPSSFIRLGLFNVAAAAASLYRHLVAERFDKAALIHLQIAENQNNTKLDSQNGMPLSRHII